MKAIFEKLAKEYGTTLRTNSECCAFFTFEEKNGKGESITVEMTRSESTGGKGSLPYLWHKNGHTPHVLKTWWNVTVYVTRPDGVCYGGYNPQTIYKVGQRPTIDFNYMFESTEENAVKLFDEIIKRAFA